MPGHTHEFEEYDRRGDPAAIYTTWARCSCGLGVRHRYLNRRVYEVRVQLVRLGDWVDPVEVLTRPLPFRLCRQCQGRRCAACRDLGVVYA